MSKNDYTLDQHVGGMPIVVAWRITHHMMLTFEMDYEAVEAVVPKPLVPLEIRPGVGLFSLAALRYCSGHFGRPDSPGFSEIVGIVTVPPNLSLPMPNPRFSFFALNVFSDSVDFVEGEKETVYTPTVHSPSLQAVFGDDGRSVQVFDDDGPIADFVNTNPDLRFKPKLLWGQHFNDTKGPLHNGTWTWEGVAAEHQKPGDWGALHPHRFFKGLDLSAVQRCMFQMVARVGAGDVHMERFYKVRRWPEG